MVKTLMTTCAFILVSGNICHAQTRPISNGERSLITSSYGHLLKDARSAQYRMQPIPLIDNQKGGKFVYCFEVNAIHMAAIRVTRPSSARLHDRTVRSYRLAMMAILMTTRGQFPARPQICAELSDIPSLRITDVRCCLVQATSDRPHQTTD